MTASDMLAIPGFGVIGLVVIGNSPYLPNDWYEQPIECDTDWTEKPTSPAGVQYKECDNAT